MRAAAGAARHTDGSERHSLQPLGANGLPAFVAQAVGPFVQLLQRPVDLGQRGGGGASCCGGADPLDGLGGPLTDALPERQVGPCLRRLRQLFKAGGELAPPCLQKSQNLIQFDLQMLRARRAYGRIGSPAGETTNQTSPIPWPFVSPALSSPEK
jgi:hypothetical protein